MWDFRIGAACKLLLRTLPFLVLRLVVYAAITIGYILVTGIGAGIGYGVGTVGGAEGHAMGTFWGGAIGFGLFGGLMYWAREYILYLVKAGHIAVLVELIEERELPGGKSQIEHGTAIVKDRFVQSSVLFGIDRLIKAVIGGMTRLFEGVMSVLPLPGVEQLGAIFKAFLRMSLGFVDELILAQIIRTDSDNAWASARDSLILYGQNHKIMLKNAAFLALIVYAASFLIFLVMLIPAAAVVYLLPGSLSLATFVFAVLFAWALKATLLEPFALTCMMQVYFKTVEGQQPDPEWEAKLDKMSGKFRKLKERAAAYIRPAQQDANRQGA